MSFHIEITANDEQRTVVYSGDVEDFDLVEGTPAIIRATKPVSIGWSNPLTDME